MSDFEKTSVLAKNDQPPYFVETQTEVHTIKKYNPEYGDSRECKCGHSYYRHFDSWEGMEAVGCKYCDCRHFEEALVESVSEHQETPVLFGTSISPQPENLTCSCFEADCSKPKPGYHLAPITKGELGEVSKIQEELDELKDALAQDSKIMALVELADVFGAMEAYLNCHHPGVNVSDLKTFADITKRAFDNGHR